MSILLFILVIFTTPLMFQIIWNTSIITVCAYFGYTIDPITYGVAFVISSIISFLFSKSSTTKDDPNFWKTVLFKYIALWVQVGLICLATSIVF